jgi:C-terminal processing protease CtpA/Prc
MKKNLYILSIMILIFSCGNNLLDNNYSNTITGNFEAIWNEFDLTYGAFTAKNIDWNTLKLIHGSNLTDESSDRELYDAISGLLSELNDGHVALCSPCYGWFSSWNRQSKSYYVDVYVYHTLYTEWTGALKNYLKSSIKEDTNSEWVQFYGIINNNETKIGYINIPTFVESGYNSKFIQTAIDTFNYLEGVLVDLRFNRGGISEIAVQCLNSFACTPALFLKSKYRNGPAHNDFTKMYDSWINPHNNCLKNKPIVILMNSFTSSASELFILGMKTQANVFTVGDTTTGALSSVRQRILPNGWSYSICSSVIYNPDGTLLTDVNGNYLEGIGIAPDFYVPDYYYHIMKGNDVPLDTALQKLYDKIASQKNRINYN